MANKFASYVSVQVEFYVSFVEIFKGPWLRFGDTYVHLEVVVLPVHRMRLW